MPAGLACCWRTPTRRWRSWKGVDPGGVLMPERTPLHDVAAQAGAVFTEEAGWEIPAGFGDPAAEYARARAGTGLWDVSHRGKVELTGPEASTFLHNLCTNDVNDLALGAGVEAFLTTNKAKVVV